MSVCPYGTTRLPLDGLSWNLIFNCFKKICLENSSFIKTGHYVTRIPIYIFDHISRKMFQTKVVKNFFSPRKSYRLWDKVENITPRGRTQKTMWRMHIACWILKATNTQLEYVMLIAFHCKNGCTNTPRLYYICSLLLVLVIFILVFTLLTRLCFSNNLLP